MIIFSKEIREFLEENRTKIMIILYVILTCYLFRIISEIFHEILGHGLLTVLFGGKVNGIHISLISPLDTSHITLDQDNLTQEQQLIAVSGGIIIDLTISFLLQAILLLRRIEWKFSIPMLWLAFWCHSNETGIIIGNALTGLKGDMTGLIEAGVISSPIALMVGISLYFLGFFLISTIIRRLLADYSIDKSKIRYYIFIFWMIVPLNILLYILKTGYLSSLIIGLIPLVISYLLEFQIIPRMEEGKIETSNPR
ncbi:MAG: hypothetical protein ACFE95_04340 [Candidatus Hodarchaeota archaeon]